MNDTDDFAKMYMREREIIMKLSREELIERIHQIQDILWEARASLAAARDKRRELDSNDLDENK